MRATHKNGVRTLTLEKPELKALERARDVLQGIAELGTGLERDAATEAVGGLVTILEAHRKPEAATA